MKALYWDGSELRLVERERPAAREGWAVVRVAAAGICDTDLQITRGYMGFQGVLGHEMSGVVEEGPPPWPGRRVVAEINLACGHCALCRRGLRRHCPTRRVMGILAADGAFAEYVAVPVANLHPIPDSVTDQEAVFTEPLAAAFEILEQVHIRPDDRVAIFGDGKLGLLVAQVLRRTGADLTVVGHHRDKLALLGAWGVRGVLEEEWDRAPADIAVDATGSPDGFALALGAVRPRGTLVLKTTVADRPPADLARVVIDEIRVVGSRCGPFAPALRALEERSVDVRPLVAARFPLEEGPGAFAAAARKGALKVLLEPAGR